MLKDKEDKARKALYWLRPFPEKVDPELLEIKEAIEAERALSTGTEIMDIIRNPIDRRRTILAVGAVSLQAASGAMYMICTYTCASHDADITLTLCTQRTALISLRWLTSVTHLKTHVSSQLQV